MSVRPDDGVLTEVTVERIFFFKEQLKSWSKNEKPKFFKNICCVLSVGAVQLARWMWRRGGRELTRHVIYVRGREGGG